MPGLFGQMKAWPWMDDSELEELSKQGTRAILDEVPQIIVASSESFFLRAWSRL